MKQYKELELLIRLESIYMTNGKSHVLEQIRKDIYKLEGEITNKEDD